MLRTHVQTTIYQNKVLKAVRVRLQRFSKLCTSIDLQRHTHYEDNTRDTIGFTNTSHFQNTCAHAKIFAHTSYKKLEGTLFLTVKNVKLYNIFIVFSTYPLYNQVKISSRLLS